MSKPLRGIRLRAADAPGPDGGLTRPGALCDQLQVIEEGGETILVTPGKAPPPPTTKPSRELVNKYCTIFQKVMFTDDGISEELLDCMSLGNELYMQRVNVSANAVMPEATDYADTLLMPAFDSVMEWVELLHHEDPALLRDEDLDRLKLARELVFGHQGVQDAQDPLQWGSLARQRLALQVIDEFCRRIAKDGAPAITRNRILTKKLAPLMMFWNKRNEKAAQTRQLKAEVAHEVEAETLERVKEANSGQGQPGGSAPGSGGVPGAHTPGQTPVPAGAGPVIPASQHPKPKRRGTPGAQAPKNKTR